MALKSVYRDDSRIVGFLDQYLCYQAEFLYEFSFWVFLSAISYRKSESITLTPEVRSRIQKNAEEVYDRCIAIFLERNERNCISVDPYIQMAFHFLTENVLLSNFDTIDEAKPESMRLLEHFYALRTLSTIYGNFHEIREMAHEDLTILTELSYYKSMLLMSAEQIRGYISGETALKEFHQVRTALSGKTKQERKRIKERYVWNEYLKFSRGNKDAQFMKLNKIAEKIRESVKDDLKQQGIESISISKIEEIIRKRRKPQS